MTNEIVTPDYIIFLKENWLNIAFGLGGLAGTIYGYLSWKNAKKEKKVYGYLFDLAEKNIDKNITEQKIAKQKKEVQKISQEVESLQEQIRKDIPKEARRAVLKDRLHANIALLNQYFQTTKKIKKELNHLGSTANIPPELLKAIELEISPEYLQKEKQANLKTYLTIVTTAAAILSAVVPYEISRALSVALLIVALPILFLLFKSSLPLNRALRKRFIYNLYTMVLSVASLICGGFSAFILFIMLTQYRHDHALEVMAFMFTCLTFIGIFSATHLNKKRKMLYVTEGSEEFIKTESG